MGPRVKSIAEAFAYRKEGNSQVVLQVNSISVYNEEIELWNLADTYNPDVIIGKESWPKEVISNAKVFRTDFKLSEGIGLPELVGVLSVLRKSLPLRSYG